MQTILDKLEQSPTALLRCCERIESQHKNLTLDFDTLNNERGYVVAKMDTTKNVLIVEKDFYNLKVGTYSVFDVVLRIMSGGNLWQAANVIYELLDETLPYIRVGINWFKVISREDRYGIKREELAPWNTMTLKQDHGKDAIFNIPKYDSFIMNPNNLHYNRTIDNSYNQYAPFEHEASMGGDFHWTENLLKHIFGDQYELGLQYMQCLYLHPKQPLPILVLASEERATGKSTYLNYLDILFGANMVVINPQDISSSFNDSYGLKNIIGIEESRFDSIQVTEKLKAISTQNKMLINPKGITPYSVSFFGKLIILTNDEHKFSKVDQAEVRYWIRKVPSLKGGNRNTDILNDLKAEIPNFLAHLQSLPELDFTRDRALFTPDQLETELLKEVKSESMTGLYKYMHEHFVRIFDNDASLESMDFVPLDIKERWFANESKFDPAYIRSVLKKEFHLSPQTNPQRYAALDDNTLDAKKLGRHYTIHRSDVIKNEYKGETDGLPF